MFHTSVCYCRLLSVPLCSTPPSREEEAGIAPNAVSRAAEEEGESGAAPSRVEKRVATAEPAEERKAEHLACEKA